ncbi:MAG TPA: hypothetical protein VIL15_02555 [Coriobacteriia bacterium]
MALRARPLSGRHAILLAPFRVAYVPGWSVGAQAVRTDASRRGVGTLGAATTGIVTFLGNTVVASLVGVALGVSMLALTRAGVGMFTPETLELGAVRAVVLMVLGMVAGFVGLLLYYLYVRAGLTPFGLGMIAGFLVPALVALFRAK